VICAWDLGVDLRGKPSVYDVTAQSSPHSAASGTPPGRAGSFSTRTVTPHQHPPPTSLRYQVQAHSHWVNDVTLVHNHQALVSASSDISVKIWRPTAFGNAPPLTIGSHTDYVKCLAYPGHNMSWVASGSLDRKIALWDLGGNGEVLKINVPEEEASATKGSVYALAATSNLIAAGGPESVVRVWDARSGRRITKFVGHTDMVRAVLVAEDGETVMSASTDQTVKVWSMSAGRCMYTLTMHNDSVWSLHSDDPQLGVVYSTDRSGLVAKTDSRGRSEIDDGLCVAVCQEPQGVNRVVAGGGYLWTATSSSSINRWVDVATEDAEVLLPEPFSMTQRGSITTLSNIHKPRFHSNSITHSIAEQPRYTNSPTPAPPVRNNSNSTTMGTNQLPFRSILRLSNMAAFPVLRNKEADAQTTYSLQRKATEPFEPDNISAMGMVPMRIVPEYTIEGQHGLIKHIMLNDKRRVLTLDAAGEVLLWDLLKVCLLFSNYAANFKSAFRQKTLASMRT
jgi:WD repeat-containing protein 48